VSPAAAVFEESSTADEPALKSLLGVGVASVAPLESLTTPASPSDVADIDAQRESTTPAKPDAPLAIRTYVVEPGDSVRTIAKQFGVTNETIIWENDLTDPDILRVGQELQILPFSGLIHEVRPGDTVASVANGYEARIEDVIRANSLSDPYIIVVGQKLAVPGGYRPLPKKVVVAPAPAPDTVQAPHSDTDQVAAVVNVAPRHKLPVLGGTPQEQFIASIGEAAVESADATGVPASVTIAQAILESYWGSSRLAREANNFFGIKAQTRGGSAGSIWFDVWEVIGGRNIMQSQAFRAYNSIADSFVDHGRFFVENGRYAGAMAVKDDPRQFAREVNRAGYATDPSYASKLIGLMDRYDLYRFDDV
jgi:flagellum-specific peptidoglycan hydrolase FlgJ